MIVEEFFDLDPPGAIVEALRLQALFDRAPERDDVRREQRKQQRTSVPSFDMTGAFTTEQKCTADQIQHPFYADERINVRDLGQKLAEKGLIEKLFTKDTLVNGRIERVASIIRQIAAAGDYFPVAEVDQARINEWSTTYLRHWLRGRQLHGRPQLSPSAIDDASLTELRDAWFASVVSDAHEKYQGIEKYQEMIVKWVGAMRSAKANDELKALEDTLAKGWAALSLEDRAGGAEVYWTENAQRGKLKLDARKGAKLIQQWKQDGAS